MSSTQHPYHPAKPLIYSASILASDDWVVGKPHGSCASGVFGVLGASGMSS